MKHRHNKVIVFDLETTGLNKTSDRVIQFAAQIFNWEDVDRGDYSKPLKEIKKFFLPDDGTEVSLGAYYKHHLSREVLKDYPSFSVFAADCVALFEDCDTLTYNGISCDIPFLTAELARYGYSIDWANRDNYDAYQTEMTRHNNKLENVYTRYNGQTMTESGLEAHDAFSDVKATVAVFAGQNKDEYQLPAKYVTDDGSLKLDTVEDELCIVFANGKYFGIPVKTVVMKDPGYIRWTLSANFSSRTKEIISKFVEIYGQKKTA